MNRLSVAKPLSASLIVLHLMTYAMPAAHAAPGTLATTPLFLSTAIEPNIMFLLDDSGSMAWETLVASNSSGLPTIGGVPRYYVIPSADNGLDQYYGGSYHPYTDPSDASVPGAWVVRNSTFNTVYYNPAITYKPWAGVNSSGNALYSDASPTAAPLDPANASAGTIDLTQSITYDNYTSSKGWFSDTLYPATYYTWTDSNGNGLVDASDTHTAVQIVSTNNSYPKAATRTDCAGSTCTYAEEIQNFANWYSYHRTHSYAAKAAIGSVINGATNDRMGLQVYNNGLISNAADINTASNKRSLLQDTYGLSIPCTMSNCPGTPARDALKSVGDLFSGSNSPILSSSNGGTCQQNFDVIVTDGYWNGSSPSVGNTDGDHDTQFDGPPYGDSYSDTLADVAMKYYETDLKPSMANNVPVIPGIDYNEQQHLVTYGVGFGVNGTLDPATADPTATGFSWPDPTSGSPEKIDDLWHATYNGRGGFFNAQNPDQLTTALGSTIQGISDRTGSAAAVAFNSTTLGTNSFVYQAQFNTAHWSGQLLSFALNPNNGDIANNATWNTGTVLDARNLTTNPRTILTYDSATSSGIPFEWADLTTAEQNDLRTNPAGGTDSATIGQERLAYLRGDRSLEGSPFRVRGSRLGDLVHSNPVYVGAPDLAFTDTAPFPSTAGSTYTDFKNAQAAKNGGSGREDVIYIGGNDGMLHGFDAATGSEVLGYIPSNLFSTANGAGLHYLTDPSYAHRYYVDLTPTVSDAYTMTSPTDTGPHWATVLIGGERAGGRGLFALNVTDPANFSESGTAPKDTVMWQFTDQDDPDLGYTFSQPTIAMTNAVDANGNHRWAAIFGNGYNDTGSGQAELFILFLDGGIDGTWTPSSDYIKITTGTGTSANPNGLSSPRLVDTNGDGIVDRVYAGDLQGHLWAFDLSSASTSNWNVAYSQGSTPQPLFTATDSSGTPQPITAQPVAVVNPAVPISTSPSNEPDLLVYFGTGEYLVNGDKSSTGTQTFYGVWDDGTKNLARSNLVQQTFQTGYPSGVRVLTNNAVDYTSQYGWYIDLPDTGERVVTNAKVRGDLVFFNTLIPDTQPCSFGGSGWLMSVQQANGGTPKKPAFDFNNDNVVDSNDLVTQTNTGQTAAPAGHIFTQGIPAESNFLGNYQYTPGSNGDLGKTTTDPGGSSYIGRLSWREIRF